MESFISLIEGFWKFVIVFKVFLGLVSKDLVIEVVVFFLGVFSR